LADGHLWDALCRAYDALGFLPRRRIPRSTGGCPPGRNAERADVPLAGIKVCASICGMKVRRLACHRGWCLAAPAMRDLVFIRTTMSMPVLAERSPGLGRGISGLGVIRVRNGLQEGSTGEPL